MESVVHVDEVERLVGKWQPLDVGDNRRYREPGPARTLERSMSGADRNIREDNSCARSSEELRVHARAAHRQRGCVVEQRSQSSHAAPEIVLVSQR
jgi:hypothetical protein